jgi:hypothetical protein
MKLKIAQVKVGEDCECLVFFQEEKLYWIENIQILKASEFILTSKRINATFSSNL